MKKIFIITVLLNLFGVTCFSQKCQADSIYYYLCNFLVYSNKNITQEYMNEFKADYSKLIKIHNLICDKEYNCKPKFQEDFNLYEFDFIGSQSECAYILIIVYDKYKIFRYSDLSLIIDELFMIKESNSDLLNDKLFITLLKEIVNNAKSADTYYHNISKNMTFFISGS
ncbi:MAG: hypothetical protein LBR64_00940 [Dysgonamonadaceae bacterium]|jgi:hypothetical protein|nr:hypothetical protein [Dysgonamonadaceae bacterium]